MHRLAHIHRSLRIYWQRLANVLQHFAHIGIDLRMFCTTSHILGETCECSAPLSTYSHRHPSIMHLSAHIRMSMLIYCTTWHIFTGLSEYIWRSIPMFCYYWHGIRTTRRLVRVSGARGQTSILRPHSPQKIIKYKNNISSI